MLDMSWLSIHQVWWQKVTLQGTNISPKNGILRMIFLFPRWDMLVPWRVYLQVWKGVPFSSSSELAILGDELEPWRVMIMVDWWNGRTSCLARVIYLLKRFAGVFENCCVFFVLLFLCFRKNCSKRSHHHFVVFFVPPHGYKKHRKQVSTRSKLLGIIPNRAIWRPGMIWSLAWSLEMNEKKKHP